MLVHAHSGLRWLVLGLLLYAIYNAIGRNKSSYEKKAKVSFASGWMKDAALRFYGMEHLIGMFTAIVVITIGRKLAEKQETPTQKNKKIAIWYLMGLVLILASIPWPFRGLGGLWF